MTRKFENVGFNAADVRVEETGDHAYVERHFYFKKDGVWGFFFYNFEVVFRAGRVSSSVYGEKSLFDGGNWKYGDGFRKLCIFDGNGGSFDGFKVNLIVFSALKKVIFVALSKVNLTQIARNEE